MNTYCWLSSLIYITYEEANFWSGTFSISLTFLTQYVCSQHVHIWDLFHKIVVLGNIKVRLLQCFWPTHQLNDTFNSYLAIADRICRGLSNSEQHEMWSRAKWNMQVGWFLHFRAGKKNVRKEWLHMHPDAFKPQQIISYNPTVMFLYFGYTHLIIVFVDVLVQLM